MKYLSSQNGQSLIILVLMIAIVLALVSAASYRLTTQTQTSVLQEDAVRALAAADSGIEIGLQRANTEPAQVYTFAGLGLTLPGIDAARSTVTITNSSTQFITPLIQKDQQFTYHVEDYANPQIGNAMNFLYIHFLPQGSDCFPARTQAAYEISYLYYDTTGREQVKRAVVEPCSGQAGAITTSNASNFAVAQSGTYTVGSVNFPLMLPVDLAAEGLTNLQMVIVRSLFGPSTLAFTADTGAIPQGKEVKSQAHTIGGPSKVIQVYQSLPQIPAEFFVTTF